MERSITSNDDFKLNFPSSGESPPGAQIRGKSANSNKSVKLPHNSPTTEESPDHPKSHSEKGTQVNVRTLINEVGLDSEHYEKKAKYEMVGDQAKKVNMKSHSFTKMLH